MKGLLRGIGYFLLYMVFTIVIQVALPLTLIRGNWVVEIVDSEGNHIEMTAPAM